MQPRYSREDILRLAPDASSAKSGQDLAQPRKWASIAGDETALWGECQGSGAKPYQVQVDFSDLASKCSCPSRKFPCKHALGLLFISVGAPEAVEIAPRPAWVNEWQASRQARAAKAAEKSSQPAAPRDAAVAARRRADRLQRVRTGLSDLAVWSEDLVRAGIAGAPGKGFEFFDNQARRLIDAQAPGAARLVRQLGSCAASGAGWQRGFLERLAMIHLLTVAADRAERLPPTQRADLEATLGLTVNTDELAALPSTRDDWQVVSREIEVEDRLAAQRTWLYGGSSGRAALVLHFAHGAAPLDASLTVGQQYDMELAFHPGAGPRATVRGTVAAGKTIDRPAGCECFAEMLDRFASMLAQCPWIDRLGFPLLAVTPTRWQDDWYLIDAAGQSLPLSMRDSAALIMLAVSGGGAIDVVAEFDGSTLRPLTAAHGGQWTSLVSQSREAA